MGLPNGVFGAPGWVARGGTTTTTVADPVLTLLSPPKIRDIGSQTDFKSFLGLDPFNAFAIDLDGTNESLEIAHNAAFDFNYDSAFTVSLWVKTTAGAWRGLVSKAENSVTGGPFKGWNIAMYSGKIYIFNAHDWASGGGTGMGCHGGSSGNNGDWRNLVVTFDGSALVAGTSIYYDAASQAVTGYFLDNLGTNSIQNSEPVRVGISPINGAGFTYMDGLMDEVSIWNKELSPSEVEEIYGVGAATSLTNHSAAANLVSWWRMGDGDNGAGVHDSADSSDASARVYDMSSNSYNLTPVNTEESDIGTDAP